MKFERRSGILLHPTSLPGKFGIGKFGKEAYKFIDFLYESGQTYWQMLPLNPPDFANSPYDSLSAFAGNPILIDPEGLVKDGYLKHDDIKYSPGLPVNIVDFKNAISLNVKYIYKAFDNFKSFASDKDKNFYNLFCKENNYWLNDFTLFIAIMRHNDNKPWYEWDEKIKRREAKTLNSLRKKLTEPIEKQKFFQWLFFKQWLEVKKYANNRGIQIIGDIPIFVSMNSADVWANTNLFHFDKNLNPQVLSGVPPDYFSRTGQLWGHPLYDWQTIAKNNYEWWINRFRVALKLSDVVRIDHFRGLYNYWEVQANEKTALNGKWRKGPGKNLFNAVMDELGDIKIIAEDLGDFDDKSRIGVEKLRKKYSFPGMKILQFAFGSDNKNLFLPHNFEKDFVVYTGTHDNDTSLGWYQITSSDKDRDYARRYMAVNGNDISWDLIRLAWSSIADTAITTLQDLQNLNHDARMNTPSTVNPKNWSWRFEEDSLSEELTFRLRELTKLYGRLRE